MHHLTTLANKIRLITVPMDSAESVTVLVLVAAGSRYERAVNNGISHFCEHLFFKGTKKRPTAREISAAVDAVGGEFNAFTAKEYTGFYIKCAQKHLELSLDVLSDILLNSKFVAAEIEREKGVIIEEINLYEDTPMKRVGDVFEQLLYGQQALGRAILGDKAIIRSLKRDDFVDYLNKFYLGSRMVIGVAGAVPKKIQNLVGEYFGKIGDKTSKTSKTSKTKQKQTKPGLKLFYKKTDQAHLCLGVRAYPIGHQDRYALAVLSTILGGNMSSRLFIEVRERRGLAYYIHSSPEAYLDAGYFMTQAGVDIKRLEEAVKVILEEYNKFRPQATSHKLQAELTKAKEFLKGRLILSLEDSKAVASSFSSVLLLENKVRTPQEAIKKIDQVTVADIVRVGSDIFRDSQLNLAVIGPVRDEEKMGRLLGK